MSVPKTPITITFSRPAATPPVYVSGTFTHPAWAPLKMDYKETDAGDEKEFRFYKELLVEPGRSFRYKFRVGEGRDWICDETGVVVTNNAGNKSNLIISPTSTTDTVPKKTAVNSLKTILPDNTDALSSGATTPKEDRAPLFAYECLGPYRGEECDSPFFPQSPTTPPTNHDDFDPNDPLLEEFPHDLAQILTKISSTEARLDADQTRFVGDPLSPVVRSGEAMMAEYFSQKESRAPELRGSGVEVHELPEPLELIEEREEEEPHQKSGNAVGKPAKVGEVEASVVPGANPDEGAVTDSSRAASRAEPIAAEIDKSKNDRSGGALLPGKASNDTLVVVTAVRDTSTAATAPILITNQHRAPTHRDERVENQDEEAIIDIQATKQTNKIVPPSLHPLPKTNQPSTPPKTTATLTPAAPGPAVLTPPPTPDKARHAIPSTKQSAKAL